MPTKVYNTGETEEFLQKKYNPEGSQLRKAQLRMVEMLAYIDKICKENKIIYFIAYGTLLGAVRHGGFIPWDDDVDVVMSDKDMHKFRKIVNQKPGRYVVQNHKIDKGFVAHWDVLRDTKSEYVKDDSTHNLRKYRGVQIDIFPYEYQVNDKLRTFLSKVTWQNEHRFVGRYQWIAETIFILQKVIIALAKIKAHKKSDVLSLGYENIWNLHYNYADIFPLTTIEFEDLVLPCPGNYRAMLKVDYGDNYMDIPAPSERNHHAVEKIVFYD
ncbi:LicD family protein [Ligilactobacillus equi]|uniref:Choline-binding protein n=1 Tax=Ligilactobacillus equi DPC 6820 TaxID=1392007 RepID=V7HZN0_9LACO|nr:LicD family protein [Ligilactobacillus equi]ETA74471.1 choline-binding protein [Ligilactobacillus equi DPC 6820]